MYKLFLIYFFISFSLFSQNTTTSQYIFKFKDLAMEEMYKYNIPASITLSQSIIESNFGKSKLATDGNNFFGDQIANGVYIYHLKARTTDEKASFLGRIAKFK